MDRKYKFYEEFIDPSTGMPYDGEKSPDEIQTVFFGKRELHRICRIVMKARRVKRQTTRVLEDGTTVRGEEQEVTEFYEAMGARGGWIESKNNLSQSGDCWVTGIACGDCYISEDAQVKGEVGGNAHVYGRAIIDLMTGVGGHARVFGEAKIEGGPRPPGKGLAAAGYARVAGHMKDKSVIGGFATLRAGGEMKDEGSASGYAQVCGVICKKGSALGRSIVYGVCGGSVGDDGFVEVTGQCYGGMTGGTLLLGSLGENTAMTGSAYVGQTGLVKGDKKNVASVEENAYVDGLVEKAEVLGNAVVQQTGAVSDKVSLGDNVTVGGTVSSKAKASDNAVVLGRVSDEGTAVSDNSVVSEGASVSQLSGASENASVINSTVTKHSSISGTAVIQGSIVEGKEAYGSLVYGTIKGGAVGGSANILGSVDGGTASGNSLLAGGTLTGNLQDNGSAIDCQSSVSGNGLKLKDGQSTASGNGITLDAEQAAEANQVAIEKSEDDDYAGDEAAVLLKVERN